MVQIIASGQVPIDQAFLESLDRQQLTWLSKAINCALAKQLLNACEFRVAASVVKAVHELDFELNRL